MKKSSVFALSIICVLLSGCASNKLQPGEELVEYRKLWETKSLNKLTEAQLKEDCDYLNYLLYNAYAGIDEAIDKGLQLDVKCQDIYNTMLTKKEYDGTFLTTDFSSEIYTTMSKNMDLPDQHVAVQGSGLKNSNTLYYSDTYFTKKDGKYYVLKSDKEEIKEGMLFTGPETNLYETLVDGKQAYRFGVLTTKTPRSANIELEGKPFISNVKKEKELKGKVNLSGLKTTDDTIYVSLSNCSGNFGLTDYAKYSNEYLKKDLSQIADATEGKKTFIFDLRNNGGGYREFPAKFLTAVFYYKHYDDKEFIQNIENLFSNSVSIDLKMLVSPFIMQNYKKTYNDIWKSLFEQLTDETQTFYKDYWKRMEYHPIRKYEDARMYKCTFDSFPEPDFQGDVYILINRYTASAAELGTAMAFLLQNQGINIHLVGENSCGAVQYVGCSTYALPNSGIWLYLPSEIGLSPVFGQINQFKGECNGFYPDYWTTNDNLLQVLSNLTGDEKIMENLKGLDISQL